MLSLFSFVSVLTEFRQLTGISDKRSALFWDLKTVVNAESCNTPGNPALTGPWVSLCPSDFELCQQAQPKRPESAIPYTHA